MGVFSVYPDHEALGFQASNIILEIKDNGWKTEGVLIEQPLSVEKVLNLDLMEKWGIPFDQKALGEVDVLLY